MRKFVWLCLIGVGFALTSCCLFHQAPARKPFEVRYATIELVGYVAPPGSDAAFQRILKKYDKGTHREIFKVKRYNGSTNPSLDLGDMDPGDIGDDLKAAVDKFLGGGKTRGVTSYTTRIGLNMDKSGGSKCSTSCPHPRESDEMVQEVLGLLRKYEHR